MSVAARQLVEMIIVKKLIDSAAQHGWTLTNINDGDAEYKVDGTQEALGLIFDLDDSQLTFKRLGKSNWVRLVMGNDGTDVISDYGDDSKTGGEYALANVIEYIYSWCSRLDAGLSGGSVARGRQVMAILNSLEMK